jgi:hypothetical protein
VLAKEAAAIDWLHDAFGHLKVIGHVAAAAPIFKKAGIGTEGEEGSSCWSRADRSTPSSPRPRSSVSGAANRSSAAQDRAPAPQADHCCFATTGTAN